MLNSRFRVALFVLYIWCSSPGTLGVWVNIWFWRIELSFVWCRRKYKIIVWVSHLLMSFLWRVVTPQEQFHVLHIEAITCGIADLPCDLPCAASLVGQPHQRGQGLVDQSLKKPIWLSPILVNLFYSFTIS